MFYRFRHKNMIPELTEKLLDSYTHTPTGMEHIDFAELPSRSEMTQLIYDLMTLLFPGYFGPKRPDRENLQFFTGSRLEQVYERLALQVFMGLRHRCRGDLDSCGNCENLAEKITCDFLSELPSIRATLATDVAAAWRGDPAAKSYDEIIYCYPGIFAIACYRMANSLHRKGALILPRFITEYAHHQTGCDIHPGATIDEAFFIDHATGVVIGETTDIGKNVRIYQGVTLGSLRFPKDEQGNLLRNLKRHPTLEDDVIVYAGATILGGETVIGKGAVIGGNTWITASVNAGAKVILK
jgi:serine O-acetyltransferase